MGDFFQGINGIYTLLLLAALIGAFLAGRRGFNKEVNAATDRLNETLEKEIDVLRRRIADVEQGRDRQDRIFAAIRYALKQYSLRIVINHEFVTLIDDAGQRKTATIKDIGKVTPIKTSADDDNDAV